MDETIKSVYETLYREVSKCNKEEVRSVLQSCKYINKNMPYFKQVMAGLNYKLALELNEVNKLLNIYEDGSKDYQETIEIQQEIKAKLRESLIFATEDEKEPIRIILGHSNNNNPLFLEDIRKIDDINVIKQVRNEIKGLIDRGYKFKNYMDYYAFRSCIFATETVKLGKVKPNSKGSQLRMYGFELPNRVIFLFATFQKKTTKIDKKEKETIIKHLNSVINDFETTYKLAYIDMIQSVFENENIEQIKEELKKSSKISNMLDEILQKNDKPIFKNLLNKGLSNHEIIDIITDILKMEYCFILGIEYSDKLKKEACSFSNFLKSRQDDCKSLYEIIGLDYYSDIDDCIDNLDTLIDELKEEAKINNDIQNTENNIQKCPTSEQYWFNELPLEIFNDDAWTKHRGNWLFKYNLLLNFYREYGTLDGLPSNYRAIDLKTHKVIVDSKGKEINLGYWFFYQKKRYEEGTMEDWQFDLLCKIGFVEILDKVNQKKNETELPIRTPIYRYSDSLIDKFVLYKELKDILKNMCFEELSQVSAFIDSLIKTESGINLPVIPKKVTDLENYEKENRTNECFILYKELKEKLKSMDLEKLSQVSAFVNNLGKNKKNNR